ncbi:MAG: conjugal transfer protein TraF [Thiotrichales bacterium]|nr:conjugal transfer protein TraF [Thiotrichales bacterium]
MKVTQLLFVFLVLVLQNTAFATTFDYKSAFDCEGEDRFNWYCQGKEEEEKPVETPPPVVVIPETKDTSPQESKKPKELVEFEAMQKELENKLRIAYMDPTEENLKNYIEYQNMVTQKAAIFTDVWKRTLWGNPELDYAQKFPVAQMAKATNQRVINQKEKQNWESLKEEGYGLFFFYRSDCPYCHQMANPIRIVSKQTGLEVLPISVDGVLLNDKFPNSVEDSGQAQTLQVQSTPSLFLVNARTKDIMPIATGWVSVEEIKKRIYVLTMTKPGENY